MPIFKWVNAKKTKPPTGKEVLLTNAQGRRDIGEYMPGTGWEARTYTWGKTRYENWHDEDGLIFWCEMPPEPNFTFLNTSI